MMKISSDVTGKSRLPMYVYEHLSFLKIGDVKNAVAVITLILLDIGMFPLLYPMVELVYYLAIPMLTFVHLWLIRLLFKNPYSTQFESILFIGVQELVGAICYFMLMQKIAFINFGIRNDVYYIISTLLYLLVVGILGYYQVYKYLDVEKKPKGKGVNLSNYVLVISIFPAVGYILAHRAIKQSEFAIDVVIYLVSVTFAVIMAYLSAKFIHKYAFMKANMRFVRYHEPEKKVIKQAEANGKKFIIK